MDALQQENQAQKPILVKIAPDLEWEAISAIVELAQTYKLAGIIATNTTISRDRLKTTTLAQTGKLVTAEAGGISGLPVRDRATDKHKDNYPLLASVKFLVPTMLGKRLLPVPA